MTCKEKYMNEHPGCDIDAVIDCYCPSDYGYLIDPIRCGTGDVFCEDCWYREIPEENLKTPDPIASVKKGFLELHMSADKRDREAFLEKVENLTIDADEAAKYTTNTNPAILDSGNRREFETGAVRDIQEGKGRCDLMPLDVIAVHMEDSILLFIYQFTTDGNVGHLYRVLDECPARLEMIVRPTVYLEVAKHFEEGAKKYGENNWQKGIPVHCYIDSAVRHYLKYLRGDKDEPHDRAFVWNIMCCIWTCKHKPELNEYRKENE